MHISEGVLSGPVIFSGIAATAVCTAIGLKKLDMKKIPEASLLSASFFVATFVHLPVGIGSVHLILNGIVGLLLGWAAFPVILVALLLQGVMFQYGGITILGVNTFIMAAPSVLCFYIFKKVKKSKTNRLFGAAFACGAFAVFVSSILSALALLFTDEEFFAAAGTLVAANIPVMIADGLITALCLTFLKKVQPEILE